MAYQHPANDHTRHRAVYTALHDRARVLAADMRAAGGPVVFGQTADQLDHTAECIAAHLDGEPAEFARPCTDAAAKQNLQRVEFARQLVGLAHRMNKAGATTTAGGEALDTLIASLLDGTQ